MTENITLRAFHTKEGKRVNYARVVRVDGDRVFGRALPLSRLSLAQLVVLARKNADAGVAPIGGANDRFSE